MLVSNEHWLQKLSCFRCFTDRNQGFKVLVSGNTDSDKSKVKKLTREDLLVFCDQHQLIGFSQESFSPMVFVNMVVSTDRIPLGKTTPLMPVFKSVSPMHEVYRCTSQFERPDLAMKSLQFKGYYELDLNEQEMAIVRKANESAAKYFEMSQRHSEWARKCKYVCGDGTDKWVGYANPWFNKKTGERAARRWFQIRQGGFFDQSYLSEFVNSIYSQTDVEEDRDQLTLMNEVHSTEDAENLQIFHEFMQDLQALFNLQKQLGDAMFRSFLELAFADNRDLFDLGVKMLEYRKHEDIAAQKALGSDVLRAYQYFRPATATKPTIQQCATGIHADMGLLTISPRANRPGLRVVDPCQGSWKDVETEQPENTMNVFVGEIFSKVFQHFDPVPPRAVIHYVAEEEMGVARYSFPFFLRGIPESIIPELPSKSKSKSTPRDTVKSYMEEQVLANRVWRGKRGGPKVPSSDY